MTLGASRRDATRRPRRTWFVGVVFGVLAACVGADPAFSPSPSPLEAGVTDAAVASDAELGDFRCDDAPVFEASLTALPPSPPAIPRDVVLVPPPNPHLLLVPADVADGGGTLGERTGALWLSDLLAGATGFRATFEYSAYVWSGAPGEGVALAWSTTVPRAGRDFGVCGSGLEGHALALANDGALPTLIAHGTEGCADRATGLPLLGSQLLTSANTPSPWYGVEVTVGPSRVTYAFVERGFGADAGADGASWQGSFERGGFDGKAITAIGLTARTGGESQNTAQRVRDLRVFRCNGR